jgi:hypothetical protein
LAAFAVLGVARCTLKRGSVGGGFLGFGILQAKSFFLLFWVDSNEFRVRGRFGVFSRLTGRSIYGGSFAESYTQEWRIRTAAAPPF